MPTTPQTLFDLEKKFWQSMVDQDTDAALALLDEPALMVSSHGSMQFDHGGYRKMAEQGTQVVTAFELSDMQALFASDDMAILTYRVRQSVAARGAASGSSKTEVMTDTSTWVRKGARWHCVAHTETPAAK